MGREVFNRGLAIFPGYIKTRVRTPKSKLSKKKPTCNRNFHLHNIADSLCIQMDPLFRAAIGLPPPLHLEESPSMALDVPASFVAMKAAATENSPTRDDDSESVYYINTIPSIPQAEAALAKLEEDNQFTCSYWSAKAIEAADLKIDKKELPTGDDIDAKTKRANYRIRVIEHAMNSSTW